MSNQSEDWSPQIDSDQVDNPEGDDLYDPQFTPELEDAHHASENAQPTDSSADQPVLLDLQPTGPQSFTSAQSTHESQVQYNQNLNSGPIVATLNGQRIGLLYLNHSIDIQHILTPPGITLHIPTTLVLDPNYTQPAFNHTSNLPTSAQNIPTANPPNKPNKVVDSKARAVPKKPVSHYKDAAEEPIGLSKKAGDSCLTCLKQNRTCKGTVLKVVKGRKRCENCAKPGKNMSGRICYWKIPSRNVLTYEDAQDILATVYGGRIIYKNTRAGKLEKEQQATAQSEPNTLPRMDESSPGITPDIVENNEEGNVEIQDTDDFDTGFYTVEDSIDPELLSAIDSAYHSLYAAIAQDLGLPENDQSVATTLMVEHAIRQALAGSGTHQDRIEGIDQEVLEGIWNRLTFDARQATSDQEM